MFEHQFLSNKINIFKVKTQDLVCRKVRGSSLIAKIYKETKKYKHNHLMGELTTLVQSCQGNIERKEEEVGTIQIMSASKPEENFQPRHQYEVYVDIFNP